MKPVAIAFGWGLWLVAVAGAAVPDGSPATEKPLPAALQAKIAKMFESADRYSPSALAKVRGQYAQLRAVPGADARVDYAFALVLLKQHRNEEAAQLLGQFTDRQPQALSARRARIWALMAARKYPPALAEVRAAAEVLGQPQPSGGADDAAARRDLARFLGRVFAFLEGPRAGAIGADELRKAKQRVLSRVGDDRAAFDAGEETANQAFVEANAELQEARAEGAVEQEARREAIKDRKKQVDTAETKVEFAAEKLKADAKEQLERMGQEADVLQKNMARVQFNLNAVQQAIVAQQTQLQLQQTNTGSRPPVGTVPLTNVELVLRTNLLQNNLLRLGAQQAALMAQLNELDEQFNTLVARRNRLFGEEEQTASNLKSQAAKLKREEHRLERDEKAAAKHDPTDNHKSHKLTEQQQTFAKYEPFPFEQEKQRLLPSATR